MVLEVQMLTAGYGGQAVVRELSLEVGAGEILVLFGVNGAGKTTTLRTIAGLVPAMSGSVAMNGVELTSKPVHARAAGGLVLVPEGRGIFGPLTVEENLRVGGYTVSKSELTAGLERSYDLFPILAERRGKQAGFLSGGEQQMLAIARCLMSRPKVMLLDEPSMGLAPAVVEQVMDCVKDVAASGVAVLMVEQDVEVALSVADHARVMVRGDLRPESAEPLETDHVLQALMSHG